jgi:hypothetical protein
LSKYPGNWERVVSLIAKASLLVYVPVVLFQLKYATPIYGSTLFGVRTNGFYINPIIFSMALGSLSAIIFCLEGRKSIFWILLATALAITTGGRAGIVACFIVVLAAFRLVPRNRYLFPVVAAPLILMVFLGSSNEGISGRTGTEAGLNDGRLSVLTQGIQEAIDSGLDDVLLGKAIGYGTNAARAILGDEAYTAISDSTFLMIFRSFGLLALVVVVAVVVSVYRKLNNDGLIVFAIVLVYSMAQSILEQHPAYVLLSLAIIRSMRTGNYLELHGTKAQPVRYGAQP